MTPTQLIDVLSEIIDLLYQYGRTDRAAWLNERRSVVLDEQATTEVEKTATSKPPPKPRELPDEDLPQTKVSLVSVGNSKMATSTERLSTTIESRSVSRLRPGSPARIPTR